MTYEPQDERTKDTPRINLTRPVRLADQLLHDVFPEEQYPSIQSEQDAWQRAAEELVAQQRHGGGPTDMLQFFNNLVEENGGWLPVTVREGALVAPRRDGGAVRAGESLYPSEFGNDAITAMDVSDLDDAEFAELLADADPEELIRSYVGIADRRPDWDLTALLWSAFRESRTTSLDSMFGQMLAAGEDPDEIRAALERAEERQ